jgi:hypothetical protein
MGRGIELNVGTEATDILAGQNKRFTTRRHLHTNLKCKPDSALPRNFHERKNTHTAVGSLGTVARDPGYGY